MKTLFAALASVSLLTAPLALSPVPAMAQHSHGGGFSHGGFGRGGFGHGGFGRGGFGHGGFGRGGGWRGGYGWGFGGLAAGLFLGAAIADSYDYPAYYGYWGPYGAPYPYDYYDGPPPPYADDGDEGPPPGQYSGPPPQGQAQGQACGSWSWDASQSKYDWVPC
ncbi:MAG TPA: hypothetical protein VHZ26_19280 [Caulobacteraceae bacterium]|nr:hypothetical protein [Caulobacteraceae bacterium]